MTKTGAMPIVMGALMGPMMMWMLHGALTGQGAMGTDALMAFVGAHLVVALVAIGIVWAGTRLSPRLHALAARLHRPSLPHVGLMAGSAAAAAFGVHLIAHGFGGIL